MTTTEAYQVDLFTVLVLILLVLLIIFLIVSIVYFGNLMSLKIPSSSESSALFWTGIILVVILFVMLIWALVRLWTYRVVVESRAIEPTMASTKITEVEANPIETKSRVGTKSVPRTVYTEVPVTTYKKVPKTVYDEVPVVETTTAYAVPKSGNKKSTVIISKSQPKQSGGITSSSAREAETTLTPIDLDQ